MHKLLSTSSHATIAGISSPARIDDSFLSVSIAYNAFDLSNVDQLEVEWRPGITLGEALGDLPAETEWAIFLNGKEVDLKTDASRPLAKLDHIGLIVVPLGGGGAIKKILMAVAAATMIVVGALVPGMQWMLYAGISMGLGLVSNMLLAPKPPKSGTNDSDTYGIDGPKNSATEGVVYPAGYGEFRQAGNFSDCFTVNQGDTQYLYIRSILNDGEIDSISDIEINEQPIANFKNVEYRLGKGTLTDPVNNWFPSEIVQINKGIKLDTTDTIHTTTGDVDRIRLDLVFPGGLCHIDPKKGTKNNYTCEVEVHYSQTGTNNWVPLPVTQPSSSGPGYTGGSGGYINVGIAGKLAHSMAASHTPINVTATDNATGQVYQVGTIAPTDEEASAYSFDSTGAVLGNAGVTPSYTRNLSAALPDGDYTVAADNGGTIIDGSSYNGVDTYGTPYNTSSTVTFSDNRTVAIRKSIDSGNLPRGTYDVRIRRTKAEDTKDEYVSSVTLTDVAEIQNTPVPMIGTANLSLKIQLTDQLNAIPSVTAKCKLSLCNRYDVDGNVIDKVWTNRPAWIALDILLSEERGALYKPSRVDWPAWVEYAQWCEDNDIQFNGIFSEESNVNDAVRQVLRIGQAALVPFGTKISVAVDRSRDPVHVFTQGSVIKDTFQITYLSVADRANEYEFSFYDKTDRNKQKTIRYVDPKAVTFSETPRTATVDLVGVDNIDQAKKEMWKAIYSNRLIMRSIQFDNWLESINMTMGEVALIQHDMMEWGNSGRLGASSTALKLNLDQPVTLSGESHAIVHFDALKRSTTTIHLVAGKSLIVNKPAGQDFDANTLVCKRVIINGNDYEVISITNGASYHTILLTDVPVAAVGNTIELWDTDVIIETPVSAVTQNADGTSSLTLTTPLPQAPDQYANWAFGPVSTVRKPYVLSGVQGNGLEKRTLMFAEYNDAVYGPPEVEIPIPTTRISDRDVLQVRGLSVSFDDVVPADSSTVPVTLQWRSGHILNYGGADIFMSVNGAALQSVGSALNTSTYQVQVQPGNQVSFQVIAFNTRGDRAASTTAPMVQADVEVTFATLDPPTNVVVDSVHFEVDAKVSVDFTAPADMTGVRFYEVQYKRAIDANWTSVGNHKTGPVEIPGLPTGNYTAQVRSGNKFSTSVWVPADFVVAIAPGSLMANWNSSNDRNGSPIVAPTLPATGAVQHTINTDGSANVSVEWLWSGVESSIDGFRIGITRTGTDTNTAPSLTGPAASLPAGTEDVTYTVTAAQLLQGWTDADSDPLTAAGLTASNGTVVVNGDGSYSITPLANYNGNVTLSYNVTDGVDAVPTTISFTLTAANDAPVRTGNAAVLAAGTEDTAYTVTKAQLLQGWTDVDGDTLSVTNFTTSNGTVVSNADGSYTITPTANFNGPVTLTYKVSDGTAAVSTSLIYNLNAVNDAPALTGAAVVLTDGTQDSTYTVTNAQLLQGWTDVEGDSLSTTAFACNHGTFVQNGDLSYTITPTAGYSGAVQISYSVTDGSASTRAFLNFNLAPAAAVMTALATVSETTVGTAGTFVLWPVDSTDSTMALKLRAGMAADMSNLRITLMDGITDVPFWVDPDAITANGISLKGLAVRSSGRAFKIGIGTGPNRSNGAAVFDIFMDPTDKTMANVTTALSLTGSFATVQPGLNQVDCGMGALGYLNQGYCHSATQRFIADSAATSNIRCYNKNDATNTPVWTVAGNGHMNQLSRREDNGNILASSTSGTATGIVYEYSHVDGSLVRGWDFSGIAAANYYPMFIGIDGATGHAKFRIMPANVGTVGIKFYDVLVNDADGTYTVLNTRSMPSSTSGIQTMQGLYGDYNGAILGDGVDRVWYLVNTSGGKMMIYLITMADATTAAISHRFGPYTWGVESEGIGFDGTTLEVGIGTSGTNAFIAKVTLDGLDARFRNGAPRVTSAASQTFSNKTLAAAALSGKIMCRGRGLWSSPYVYNSTSNRAAIGFATLTGDTPAAVAWPGRISATPTKTQATIRSQSNGGTGVTSATATVTDQTVLGLWESVLIPQSAAGALDGSLTVYQNSIQVMQAAVASIPLASDLNKLRLMIGGGAQSDSTGMDQLTGPVCAYNVQATASVMTVA